MLGRTANGLYWMYRYLERAENIVRFVETGQRMALTRSRGAAEDWKPVLDSAGAISGFKETGEALDRDTAIDWLLRSSENHSSVASCVAAGRQNARMVRTALTGEVWEAVNAAYMKAKESLARKVAERDLNTTLADMRQYSALVRGATEGTMLRNDIYDFARIGTFIERADNTARILQSKYHTLLPSVMASGSVLDNAQWETILRSISGRGGFRMEYGNHASAQDLAQYMILDPRMPRSLAYCTAKLRSNLGYLVASRDETVPSFRLADEIMATLLSQSIGEVFDRGLLAFIKDYSGRLGELGQQIEIDFRFYE